jgi:hypothetical protein
LRFRLEGHVEGFEIDALHGGEARLVALAGRGKTAGREDRRARGFGSDSILSIV